MGETGSWVLAVTMAVSALLHTGAMVLRHPDAASSQILRSELVRAATPRAQGNWQLVEPASPEQIAAAHQKLVARARAERKQGNLRLGAFLLRAAEIDAAELGIALDIQEAE